MSNLTDQQRTLKSAQNNIADASFGLLDSIDLGVIYTMFLSPILHQFLETIGKYFLFPISFGAHAIKSILAWRQAYLDKGNQRSVVNAAVETLGTMAIGVAVIGSLVASAIFALATPIIFTATMASKTLFQGGSAIYYAGKMQGTDDPERKQHYKKLAINNVLGFVAGVIATTAVALVFLLGKTTFAVIGIVGAVVGAALSVIKGYRSFKAAQSAKQALAESTLAPSSTLTIANRLEADISKPLIAKKAKESDVEKEISTSSENEGLNQDVSYPGSALKFA